MELIIEFYKDLPRQGPGSISATRQALAFVPELDEHARILDLGCGCGAQTLTLAENLSGRITAVDTLPEFLEVLNEKSRQRGFQDRIETCGDSMDALSFPENHFDLLWSESSIYNVGFDRGIREWKKFLKPGGALVVSEICWLREERPGEIAQYWKTNYPEIDSISKTISRIEAAGYVPQAHFVLPESCWFENYYDPILEKLESFVLRREETQRLRDFLEETRLEIKMYEKYKEYYSYVFFICRNS